MEAERQPVKAMESRKAIQDAKLKLFQEFKGKFNGLDKALNELSTFHSFTELKADLGDGNSLVGVTLDKDKAQPGTYSLQIDQLAEKSSMITNGFKDPNEQVLGIGYLVVDLPD